MPSPERKPRRGLSRLRSGSYTRCMRISSFCLLFMALLSLSGCLTWEEPSARPPSVEFQGRAPGEITDPVHGAETWFAIGALTGAGTHKGNGVATAHFLADGTYVVGLRLNMKPVENTVLEASLETDRGTDSVALGRLSNPTGDARHELRYEGTRDVRDTHRHIVVRMRKKSDPSAPGEAVAEGTLKPQAR
jgi:hypothetical protein